MKQTVYIKAESTDKVLNTFALTKISDKSFVYFISKHEGYFFTEEQLKQLLSDSFDKGRDYQTNFSVINSKKTFIENFLNKEL